MQMPPLARRHLEINGLAGYLMIGLDLGLYISRGLSKCCMGVQLRFS